jgi:protein-tyrosine phosphatase
MDIHCHCLPGLDDGPGTMADAVALCRALVADGCTTAIATPHQLGRYEGLNPASRIREAVQSLNAALLEADVPLAVAPGADVRLDERIPALLDEGRVLTLADGGRYLLVELPHEVFIDLAPLLVQLAERDVTAVVSHPERNAFLVGRPEAARPWVEKGALLQVTAASLCGDFGPAVEEAAWHYLATGMAALVATDAHDLLERPPRMSQAFGLIAERLGHGLACRVCIASPAAVLTRVDVTSVGSSRALGVRK